MTTITMKEVAAFLLGEAPLDGFWFGERHPAGGFWWREHLRAALEAPSTAPEPENDCVLNHICNGRLVHLPDGEQCDRCGSVRP